MSVRVNPPPQVRIPQSFMEDAEQRAFFERLRTIMFQLWERTGGNLDLVAGQEIIQAVSVDTAVTNFSTLVISNASDAPVNITLPPVTNANLGEKVSVYIYNATNDTTVYPTAGMTIINEPSVTMNEEQMTLVFKVATTSLWVIS